MKAVGFLIGLGIGAVVCAALWPLVLFCALVVFVAALVKGPTAAEPVQQQSPSHPVSPVLPGLRAKCLAVVHERNKAHLERCLEASNS